MPSEHFQNKREKTLKGQTRTDSLEKLATIGMQDTWQGQTKQEAKKVSYMDPPKPGGETSYLRRANCIHLARPSPYYSYSQFVLDTTIRKQTQRT